MVDCQHDVEKDGGCNLNLDGNCQIQNTEHSTADSEVDWTTRKKLLVVLMALVNFVSFVAFSMLTPFFPNEALQMGASQTVIGFIFSIHPLVGLVLSPFIGILLPKFGIRIGVMTGLFLGALGQIAFEFATMLPKGIIFIIYCFGMRVVISVGGIFIDTSTFTFAAEEFPSSVATVMGILEVFTGLGFLVGPVLGGVLYTYCGFKVPFIVGGGAMMVLGLPLYFLLPVSTQGERQTSGQFNSMMKCLRVPRLWIGVSAIIASLISGTFLDPVVSPYLKHNVGMNATDIGLLFGLASFCYTLVAPLAGRLVDKKAKHLLLLNISFLGTGIGILLLGPAPILTFLPRNKVWLICVSMAVQGIFGGFGFVPCMPFMLQSVRESGLPDNLKTNAAVSGIFTSAINIGMFVGPSLSGALFNYIDFYWTTSVFAYILFAEVLFLSVCSIFTCRRAPKREGFNERDPLLKSEKRSTASDSVEIV